jgi:hypothetical protein
VNAEEIVRMLLEADGPLHIYALIDEASVHLPRRGKRWVATFRDETGNQVWKATGQRDRTAAQAIADAWAWPLYPETAAIMRISERSVRQLQKSAFTKLRNHPALKEFWREWQSGQVSEAVVPTSTGWVLSAAEIEALLSLARTPIEKHAVRKLIALTSAS